jgi:hypothetical protein
MTREIKLPPAAPSLGKSAGKVLTILALAAFLLKIILAATTFGTNDALTFELMQAKAETRGARALYREGTEARNNKGTVIQMMLMNHPPFVLRLMQFWALCRRLLGGSLHFWLRFTCACADLFAFFLIRKLLAGAPGAFWNLAVLAVAPAAIMISGFHGNTDPIMIALVVAAAYAMDRRLPVWLAGIAFGAAVSVKVWPLILAPVFFLSAQTLRRRAAFTISFLLTTFVLALPPIWTFTRLVLGNVFNYEPFSGWWGLSYLWPAGEPLLRMPMFVAIAAAAAYMHERVRSVFVQCAVVTFIFFILTPGFGPQYLAWLLPWTVAAGWPAAALFQLATGWFVFRIYTVWSHGLPWYFANAHVYGLAPEVLRIGLVSWFLLPLLAWEAYRANREPLHALKDVEQDGPAAGVARPRMSPESLWIENVAGSTWARMKNRFATELSGGRLWRKTAMGARRSAVPLALIALCGAILITQSLVRPAVGMPNNGDFPKLAGQLALGPQTGTWDSTQFTGFIYNYIRADRMRWQSGFWTSEFYCLKLARGLQRIFQPGPLFDIRWMGGVHGGLLLLGMAIWIFALPRRWQLWGGLLTLFIWTDVAYVQYLNSLYMDVIAIVSLLIGVGAGLHVVRKREQRLFPIVMIMAAFLFAASKAQHAIPALLFIPLFVAFLFWTRDRVARWVWATGSVLLLLTAAVLSHRMTDDYRSEGVFDVVFLRIAPEAPDHAAALRELGLGTQDLPFLGMHSFVTNGPMSHPEWVTEFAKRCNYTTLLGYYLRHPSVALGFLYHDLKESAPEMTPFGNRSAADRFPENARATNFTWWSGLRSFLLRRAPWLVILAALSAMAASLWLLVFSSADRPFAGLVLTVQVLAAFEFGLASLADAAETFRHLLLSNVAADLSILLVPLLLARIYAVRKQVRSSTAQHLTAAVRT